MSFIRGVFEVSAKFSYYDSGHLRHVDVHVGWAYVAALIAAVVLLVCWAV